MLTSKQDLCLAALTFCFDTLKTGGHFVCKYYQGAEEKSFENRLKRLFEKVHREKPDSSRKVSPSLYIDQVGC
jgi:21S rRNA (uridine2791-2'-O)-methyltransferase